MECFYRDLKASDDHCGYALANCNEHDVMPFIHYYFCQGNENWIAFLILGVIVNPITKAHLHGDGLAFLIEYCWRLHGSIVDLRGSEVRIIWDLGWVLVITLQRVTLIAFANGAPDVMTAYVAANSEDGILMAVGSIFGAGLFVTTVVVGRVIQVSGKLKVPKLSSISVKRNRNDKGSHF